MPQYSVADIKRLFEADIRQDKLDDIYRHLRAYTMAHRNQFKAMRLDPDDFVQDCVAAIFRRKGLDTYDPSKGLSFETLIYRIAKNHLIDIMRKQNAKSRVDASGRPIYPVSLDAPLGSDRGSDTLGSVVSDPDDDMTTTNLGRQTTARAHYDPDAPTDDLSQYGDLEDLVKDMGNSSLKSRILATLSAYDIDTYADYLIKRKELSPEKRKQLDQVMQALRSVAAESRPPSAYKALLKNVTILSESVDAFGFKNRTAFDQGYAAHNLGVNPEMANPYPKSEEKDSLYQRWLQGFNSAHKDQS